MVPKISDANAIRSMVVTVRLDPKLKYLAELGARKQRRTLSSYIEWAIERSLGDVRLEEGDGFTGPGNSVSEADKQHRLWDVDEADRFVRLALFYPELLTHPEQILWKLVRECGALWLGHFGRSDSKWTWEVKESTLRVEELRKYWQQFQKVASGEAEPSSLPSWVKTSKPSKDPMDDDIPF